MGFTAGKVTRSAYCQPIELIDMGRNLLMSSRPKSDQRIITEPRLK